MNDFRPMREMPNLKNFGPNDTLVIFGEVFDRGYVNGLVQEAQQKNMKIIFSTVGRRDQEDQLRSLTVDELSQKGQTPLINIPLEAGFDLSPCSADHTTPCDQLKGVKLTQWDNVQLDWQKINSSRENGMSDFRTRVNQWVEELSKVLSASGHVVFAHTMAGGVPRAKIVLPLLNRVFKGYGDRFMDSYEFWSSEIGKLCSKSFFDVTAQTFFHLIDQTHEMRQQRQANGFNVSYVAYGYHGTELLINNKMQWQSYSPYLQGFAKLELENIAKKAWSEGIHATVFNAPEILTNSSSVFLGIEVAVYPLISALKKELGQHSLLEEIESQLKEYLKPDCNLNQILTLTDEYYQSDVVKDWSQYANWPQHNGPEQMKLMRETSQKIIQMHRDSKFMLTEQLSEIIFKACGKIMLNEAHLPQNPVWWIGHDIVAKATKSGLE